MSERVLILEVQLFPALSSRRTLAPRHQGCAAPEAAQGAGAPGEALQQQLEPRQWLRVPGRGLREASELIYCRERLLLL